MDNFNPQKCYIEKADNTRVTENWVNVNYYFQLISSFVYLIILIYFFFSLKTYFAGTVGANGFRYFLLYWLGWPNLKIFINVLFAPKLKFDSSNRLISVNNKPFSIDRAKTIDIVEICPYHYSWRWGQTPAFNLSGYKKSVIQIGTDYGVVNFYVCSKKSLNTFIAFLEKFNKNYSYSYDERRLWFTFY